MACTTILVGKKASYDGSTMIARNDDSSSGKFTEKKLVSVLPEQQPRKYRSVISHVEIELPDNPMRYTAVPNAVEGEGIWAAAGVNAANVSMSATETITSNVRVQGADPLVEYVPAGDGQPEKAGGIGEEDLVVLVLPYIHTAREGVLRLGQLLEQYGTYEMNGIAFQDVNEIWWLETIGGHHWMARRVPDDAYVAMPNQLGLDYFDLADAFGAQKEFLCSSDLREFILENHLDLSPDNDTEKGGAVNPRLIFGSHDDSDHIYNTPRAWVIERYFNPRDNVWDGMEADYRPEDDDIPWCRVPEHKVTVEDVKYVLSNHFQGTPYDPYGRHDVPERNMYRSIGVNRTSFLSLVQLRPYVDERIQAVEWITFGSNVFNAFVPFYANVDSIPAYLGNTTGTVSTENFYWANRLIGALADAQYRLTAIHIERYQNAVAGKGHELLGRFDRTEGQDLAAANQEIADMLRKETDQVLGKVLYEVSCKMKNAFARSDA